MQPKKSTRTKSSANKTNFKKSSTPKKQRRPVSDKSGRPSIDPVRDLSASDDLFYINDKKYIDINKVDYDQEKKKVYIVAILIPFVIILAILWFVNLKKNVGESAQQLSLKGIQQQIDNSIGQFKNSFEFNNGTSTDQQLTTEQIAKIKGEIMDKVKNSLDPSSWPVHESSLMKVSIQYPTTWSSRDESKLIRIFNSAVNASTTSSSEAEIAISLKTATKSTKLNDWLKKNFTATNYEKVSTTDFSIPNRQIIQFNNASNTGNQINSILFLQNSNQIYQINVKSTDKDSNGFIIDKIIKSIKLL